jgi:phosphatidylinositol dimannoside acyltransferase
MATTSELAYRLGWRVVRLLPERMAHRLFRGLADWAWSRQGARVVQLERNLARVVADPRSVSKAAMRSYLRYWCEVFRLPDWSQDRIVQSVSVTGEHHLTDALAQGGVVVALPHMGNWDHAAAWASLVHGHVVTVAERLEPEALFQRFLSFRERLGMEIFAHDDPEVTERLCERLRQGSLVALLADRDMSRSGVPVTLLGEATTFPRGPARLAALTGATLLPASLWCRDGVLHVDFADPVEVGDLETTTQCLADVFSHAIRQHPEEWHVLQRVFTADRRRISAPAPTPDI